MSADASSNPLKLTQGEPRPLVNGQHVRTDLRLLEVDHALLETILTDGVVIKGPQASNEAVLCTDAKTFALKYVETTNCQLLVQPLEDLDSSTQGSQQALGTPGSAGPALSPPGLQTQVQQLHRSSGPPAVVTATTSGHIEVVECGPRLELLHQLLAQRPYGLEDEGVQGSGEQHNQAEADPDQEPGHRSKWQALESGSAGVQGSGGSSSSRIEADSRAKSHRVASTSGLHTFDDLVQLVQASPKEIQAELTAMGAIELDGHWRCIDPSYLGQLLELIILSAQELGLPLTAIPSSAVADALAPGGYLPQLVTHCLSVYGRPSTAEDGRVSEGAWALDEKKVCIYFMDKLFAQRDGGLGSKGDSRKRPITVVPSSAWPLREFMQQWREAVPASMQPELSMLRGEVLVEGKGSDAVVRPLSIRQLPINPKQRFERLFAFKPQWEATEMEPYLQGMQAPGQTPAMLLLRYARASQARADAPLIYTAR